MTVAIVYGVRTNGANTGATFSEASAKTAIQGYLDALEHRDTDDIVRNALCGLYDGVKDKRSDQALAKLSSDAFRKQFSDVEVTSIDKIVYLSQYQAQVLFTHAGVTRRPAARCAAGARHRAAAIPARRDLGVLVRAAYRGRCTSPARQLAGQLNESPHAHEPVALGLSMVKPCFSMVSTKSMDAPSHVRRAHPVHRQRHAAELRGQVAIQRPVVEEEVVAQPRTPARLNRDAQRQVVASLLVQQGLRLGGGGLGQDHAVGLWRSTRSAPSLLLLHASLSGGSAAARWITWRSGPLGETHFLNGTLPDRYSRVAPLPQMPIPSADWPRRPAPAAPNRRIRRWTGQT